MLKRTLMQVYVRHSAEAVEMYRQAFDADTGNDWRNPDGSCAHIELDIGGQIIAISEAPGDAPSGGRMQFCLHYDPTDRTAVQRAYDVLQTGAAIECPPGPCPYSSYMFALTDRFGVRWCVFC